MSRRCRFCGEKIQIGVEQCGHCGKMLGKTNPESKESGGLTNLKSWKQKTVPTWLMFLLVAAALFCVWIMLTRGCE